MSRLFSKKRPAGLTAASTAQEIFAAYEKVETDDETLYKANLAAIDRPPRQDARSAADRRRSEGDRVRLLPVLLLRPVHSGTGRRAAAGAAGERSDVRRSDDGRRRHGTRPELPGQRGELRAAEGARGQEPARAGCRQLRRHRRRFAAWARTSAITARSSRRSTSRTSNSIWGATGSGEQFCANVASLPMDESSTFIRSVRSGNFVPGVGLDSELGNMASETKSCGMTGAARLLFRSGVLGRPLVAQPPARSRR